MWIAPRHISSHPLEPLGEIEEVATHFRKLCRMRQRPYLGGGLAIIVRSRSWLVCHVVLKGSPVGNAYPSFEVPKFGSAAQIDHSSDNNNM